MQQLSMRDLAVLDLAVRLLAREHHGHSPIRSGKVKPAAVISACKVMSMQGTFDIEYRSWQTSILKYQ